AGVARRALDECRSGPELAGLFGRLDHLEADAVLDRTAGVRAFELEEQLAGAGIESPRADHRRAADEFEYAFVDRHGNSGRRALRVRPLSRSPAGLGSRPPDAPRRGAPPIGIARARVPRRQAVAASRCDHISVSLSLARSFSFLRLCKVTSSIGSTPISASCTLLSSSLCRW